MSTLAAQPKHEDDDILGLLPMRPAVTHPTRASIPLAGGLYLITAGRVAVYRGEHTVIAFFTQDDLILALPGTHAVALEETSIRHWTTAEVEGLIKRTPFLGVLLLRLAVAQNLSARLRSVTHGRTRQRVAMAVLSLSERFGVREGASVTAPAFTHKMIAEYVGTSREVVTYAFTGLRRKGILAYSRQGMTVQIEALRAELRRADKEEK